MPEAIATTKRKFYRVLDSLNNPPATRPTEPAAKRARRSISSTSTTNASLLSNVSAARKEAVERKEPPNFSPWSHETFLARLKTFSNVSLWHPKPEAISEVAWAKRGWVCVDVNTVACRGGCERRVVVSLDFDKKPATNGLSGDDGDDAGKEDEDEDDETALEDALARRYQAMIVAGHAETCMWHKAGCKDDIYRLQVIRPSIWQPELRDRYRSILDISDSTRNVKVRGLSNDAPSSLSPQRLLGELPSDVLGTADPNPTLDESAPALEIALHGWRGSSDSGTDLLHCDACFQRIGLWMYQPDYKPSHSSSDEGSEDTGTIDLVELHREHCPWRNAITQKASGSLSGLNACQILRRVVATYAREQRRRSDDLRKTAERPEADEDDANDDDGDRAPASPAPSRDEIAKQDKERESRLRKLTRLFTVKRRSAPDTKPVVATRPR